MQAVYIPILIVSRADEEQAEPVTTVGVRVVRGAVEVDALGESVLSDCEESFGREEMSVELDERAVWALDVEGDVCWLRVALDRAGEEALVEDQSRRNHLVADRRVGEGWVARRAAVV